MSEVLPLIPAERHRRIEETLRHENIVRVSTLSDLLGVSEMTVRRDLEKLEHLGVLDRTHGGAVLRQRMAAESMYINNVLAHAEQKQRIARAAASLIAANDTVFLGSGTTTPQILLYLDPELPVRVVTNNLGALNVVHGKAVELLLVGGAYREKTHSLEGPWTTEILSQVYATKLFLSVDGISSGAGFTTPGLGEAMIERAMIRQTRGQVVVLADNSKFGMVADIVIGTLDDADVVIVDGEVPAAHLQDMKDHGLQVIVV
ncbi:MAG: DeoR/GlpR family DNA-binding transcription regulator [Thermoleophilia bacterium]|jgi:DeoR/GlpR family transcriptional regulator of sugar metabolism